MQQEKLVVKKKPNTYNIWLNVAVFLLYLCIIGALALDCFIIGFYGADYMVSFIFFVWQLLSDNYVTILVSVALLAYGDEIEAFFWLIFLLITDEKDAISWREDQD